VTDLHSRRSHPKHVGSAAVKRAQGPQLGAATPSDGRLLVEITGVGRFADRQNKGGVRTSRTPLNEHATRVLRALTGDWQPSRNISHATGLTATQVSAALRELRRAGSVDRRKLGANVGAKSEWRLFP
jgi:hypothetical protein